MVWNLKQEKPQRQRRCSTHDVIETISTFAIKARTHGNVFMRFCIVSSNELVVSIPLRTVNNTKTQENVSVHIKETEISQKQSKGIKNWKTTYSVILSVLSNETNLILGFSSPLMMMKGCTELLHSKKPHMFKTEQAQYLRLWLCWW